MSANLEFVPFESLTELEVDEAAAQIHAMVSRPDVTRLLNDTLYLPGVVTRHAVSPERSAEGIRYVRETAAAQKLGAYVIRDVSLEAEEKIIGVATTQEGLPLYRQRVPLAAKYTRNLLLGHREDTPLVNVAAWTVRRDAILSRRYNDTLEAYRFLRMTTPNSWTLARWESSGGITPFGSSLAEAGYRPVGKSHHYDDMEDEEAIPPKRTLMVSIDAYGLTWFDR